MNLAVIIPVKSFARAKARLAGELGDEEREMLSRTCAETVVAAASPLPVYVVCDDGTVAHWASERGAIAVMATEPGLDAAVAAGRRAAVSGGADHLIVAHADLPLAHDLARVAREGRVSLVPDRHRDGTNVLSFPAASGFHTAYGPGSFDNHVRLAALAGLACEVISDSGLELDLDTADDLTELALRRASVSDGAHHARPTTGA